MDDVSTEVPPNHTIPSVSSLIHLCFQIFRQNLLLPLLFYTLLQTHLGYLDHLGQLLRLHVGCLDHRL